MPDRKERFRITCTIDLDFADEYGDCNTAEMIEWLQNHVRGLTDSHHGCYMDSNINVEYVGPTPLSLETSNA
jgi:hypothetical protein